MNHRFALPSALLCALLLSGSAEAQSATPLSLPVKATTTQGSNPALPVFPKLGAKKELAYYRVKAQRFNIRWGKASVHKRFFKREVSFPSARTKRWKTVHGVFFGPRNPKGPVAAAVVVHHLGGSFDAEEMIAQHLATHGVAALFVSLPNYGKRREKGTKQGFMRLGGMVAFKTFQQAALDVIRAGDVLRATPGVDSSRVGLLGVSLGAFVSAVARGVDPRLRRTVLLLGGGDLVGMFNQIPQGTELLRKAGIGLDTLRVLTRPADPLTFAGRVGTADVLMLNALQDEIVPRRSTDKLWHALGRPKIRWFNCGHYGVVLHLPTLFNLSLDHLRKRKRTPL